MDIKNITADSGLSLLTERHHQLVDNAIQSAIFNKLGSIKNSEIGKNNQVFSSQLVFVNSMNSINNPLFSMVEDSFTVSVAPSAPLEAKISDFIESTANIPIPRNELLAEPLKENPYLAFAPGLH